ncbi:MAG: CoA transferase [Rhizobiales bacterium]|nr:CoA transferase [Hyphomicrobiales bacterium]
MNKASSALPLSGLFVVELGTSIAAPFGGHVLADLGAEVLKIERPGTGDDARSWGPPFIDGSAPAFQAVNRNKQSAAVDLKDAPQRDSLHRLILDRADVVLQNMRPGVVESCGLDAKTLRADKPSLIYCNLSAYGATGPLCEKPGYDPLMQACGGIMSITGHPDQEPVRVGPSIVDEAAGMWAVIGILAALNRRHLTGEGCEVGTSLFETAVGWCGLHIATYLVSKKVPQPLGTENIGNVPSKAYRASDGWIVIAAGNDKLWRHFARALGHPEWLDDPDFRANPDRVKNRERCNRLIAEVIATDARNAWHAKLEAAGVPSAPLLTIDEVVTHPQTVAVDMVQEAAGDHPPLVGVPLQFDGVRPPLRSLPPVLGAQTDRVLGLMAEEKVAT